MYTKYVYNFKKKKTSRSKESFNARITQQTLPYALIFLKITLLFFKLHYYYRSKNEEINYVRNSLILPLKSSFRIYRTFWYQFHKVTF